MDILCKRIYNMFEKYKISFNEIESANKKIESTKLNLFLLSSSFCMVNER